jgi:hypothetical protein
MLSKVLTSIGMLAGQMSFADARKDMSPQMHHKRTLQGQCSGQVYQSGMLLL